MTMRVAPPAAARTMRGIIFSALQSGQRPKHENELRRMGFEVETRDFPRAYNLAAYEVVFVVKDHADNADKDRAQDAARRAGKPWFWLTKKLSNPTWEAVAGWAKKQSLTPVDDTDSHEPTLSSRTFADALADFEKKEDADDWAKLAGEYEEAAEAARQRAKEIEALWKQSEADLKDLRARLRTATEDANATAAQREALRSEVERLQKELTTLTTAKSVGRKAVERVDETAAARLRDTDTLMRQAREERDAVKAELATAKKECMQALKAADARTDLLKQSGAVIQGLQDEIDKLNKQLKGGAFVDGEQQNAVPPGKRLVPANIEQTAEKLWSLWEDGVMDIEEVWAKLMAQLKGD